MKFIADYVIPFILFLAALMIFMFVMFFPLAWFDGHAKSAYLKQTRGMDIPWYQSTWLHVEVNSVDASVKQSR